MEKTTRLVGSTNNLEVELGQAVRRLRLHQDRTQRALANDANVSISTLKDLEKGHGSSVRTLILVMRALGQTAWIESLAPREPSISPMRMLRQRKEIAFRERKRASRNRSSKVSK